MQLPACQMPGLTTRMEMGMSEMKSNGVAKSAISILAAGAILALAAGSASAETVYSNIPSPLPGNVVSVGFEATSTAEFGGMVAFPAETARARPTVTVGMSSWACQSGTWGNNTCATVPGAKFSEPVTLNIYEVGPDNEPGAKVATMTETFEMPYRPTASKKCTTGEAEGGWYHIGSCFHGKLFKIKFSGAPLNKVVLPSEEAIISVAYNTSDYGAEPQRPKPCDGEPQGCPYDSLNLALASGAPTIGSDPLLSQEEVYVNSKWSEMYCAGVTPGSFELSGTCPHTSQSWEDYQPMIEVRAKNLG
jgi:hypothetical protein